MFIWLRARVSAKADQTLCIRQKPETRAYGRIPQKQTKADKRQEIVRKLERWLTNIQSEQDTLSK